MTIASAPEAKHGSTGRNAPGVVATTLDVSRTGQHVDFALRVVNNTARTIELEFPTSRTHDFSVLDAKGNVVWRWSNGRLFTQTMQSKAVRSRDTLTLAEGWDTHDAHGTYTAVALLATDTHPVERRIDFTLP